MHVDEVQIDAKQEADNRILTACLTAWATNMGLGRMGEISDISFHTLVSASDNFIRPETLREANDRISNAIAKLPIFRHYDLGDALHSSSDGQKFETSIHTLNARHSPKYFGLKKGIVSYTLVANNIPINAYIIGANEHESHYVFDILFNNTTDIQPEIHSTDTHGANEVNFALLPIVLFTRGGDIWWTEGLLLSAGSLLGGYFGAKLSSHEQARTWVFRILVAVIVLELIHLSIHYFG
jgi:hypothetical protein